MKLGKYAGGVCRICGSDTLGADIGCSCINMYNRAKKIALRNHEKESLYYNYTIKMKEIMDFSLKTYEESLAKHNNDINKVFHTDFNRSFFPSCFQFYRDKGYVSSKQLSIVERKYCFESDSSFYKRIEDLKENYLSAFAGEHDEEIIEIARNLWKQKKIKL